MSPEPVLESPEEYATASGAEISPCHRYRWRLWRVWDRESAFVLFIMLNPSTADAEEDDATIRRCRAFAKGWGYGGFEVVNLFPYRASEPAVMLRRRYAEIAPEDNDAYIWGACKRTHEVVCAWGAHALVEKRARAVLDIIYQAGHVPTCLLQTQDGHPSHPLYLPKDLHPVAYLGELYGR